ncbi:hypothetical protein HMPREF0877_0528 [Weissella paramesenteroides ATCC 33313]|uniref:Uncharacterized protein n=1 Tax=Weissella paramesenteroides ATCC 33313 TaxID=585506 RepID=C5R983_WEIPA|nr:hypothetical protein HMPREF0877_0528 [Weissella paramesenteroides ATCC 33313]
MVNNGKFNVTNWDGPIRSFLLYLVWKSVIIIIVIQEITSAIKPFSKVKRRSNQNGSRF